MKRIDILGKRFGKLKVIGLIKTDNNRKLWKCRCDCGKEILTRGWGLIRGRQHCCGCDNKCKFKDLTGQKFGKLSVISFNGKEQTKGGVWKYFWKCKCDCGKETVVRRGHLVSGQQISCGCMLNRKGKESALFTGYEGISGKFYGNLKRGDSRRKKKLSFEVPIEYLWKLYLKQNKKCALTGLELFFDEPGRKGNLRNASLDRIDSSKGYIEGNVQWVHKDINMMKKDYDENYFVEMCKKVASCR